MKTETKKLATRKRVHSAILSLVEPKPFRFGVVLTPIGYVKVFSDEIRTTLTFRDGAKAYKRKITGRPMYTKRGLSTIAHRFIREVK